MSTMLTEQNAQTELQSDIQTHTQTEVQSDISAINKLFLDVTEGAFGLEGLISRQKGGICERNWVRHILAVPSKEELTGPCPYSFTVWGWREFCNEWEQEKRISREEQEKIVAGLPDRTHLWKPSYRHKLRTDKAYRQRWDKDTAECELCLKKYESALNCLKSYNNEKNQHWEYCSEDFKILKELVEDLSKSSSEWDAHVGRNLNAFLDKLAKCGHAISHEAFYAKYPLDANTKGTKDSDTKAAKDKDTKAAKDVETNAKKDPINAEPVTFSLSSSLSSGNANNPNNDKMLGNTYRLFGS